MIEKKRKTISREKKHNFRSEQRKTLQNIKLKKKLVYRFFCSERCDCSFE